MFGEKRIFVLKSGEGIRLNLKILQNKKLKFVSIALSLPVALCSLIPASQAVSTVSSNPVIQTLKHELDRSMVKMRSAGKAPVYFLGYRLYEGCPERITASNGALLEETSGRSTRILSVELRVGNHNLDNTHFLRSEHSRPPTIYDRSTAQDSILPAIGSGMALREAIWLRTDDAFKQAQQRYHALKASVDVLAAEEDKSGDFTTEQPHQFESPSVSTAIDKTEWEARVKRLSRIFLDHPQIQESKVSFYSRPVTRYIVDSEGSQIIERRADFGLFADASSLTADGMELELGDYNNSCDLSDLKNEEEAVKRIERLAKTLDDLRNAPPAESYVGPAILSGRATAVFFHETFGHRIEAVHEKSEGEAKTFAQKIGTPVMPSFITVVDDPTAERAYGERLNGFYKFDDEGVPGQAVTLAKNGMLTGFLMGRTPLQGFDKSNGHGRCAPGWNPTARQSNLFVRTTKNKQYSPAELRALLIKEAKRQKKAYGLYFDEVSGGSTYTDHRTQQSYSIYPKVVYKVFVDGRKDELIRGADIVGTPLSALERIIASGTEHGVFNGSCGRESGFVPVSGVAPSLLVQSIEIKRTRKTFQKPPILPDPMEKADANPSGGAQK